MTHEALRYVHKNGTRVFLSARRRNPIRLNNKLTYLVLIYLKKMFLLSVFELLTVTVSIE